MSCCLSFDGTHVYDSMPTAESERFRKISSCWVATGTLFDFMVEDLLLSVQVRPHSRMAEPARFGCIFSKLSTTA